MSTRVIKVNGDQDVPAAARQAAKALRAGKLVGFATETVYGIAAMATIAEAMERLRELKGRPGRPFSVHVGTPGDAMRYVK
ncbi:MAG: Sua5/YciO/YrdC/YwlC family protein, partial [Phycisphaerae bacterium]